MIDISMRFDVLRSLEQHGTLQDKFNFLLGIQQFCEEQKQILQARASTEDAEIVLDDSSES